MSDKSDLMVALVSAVIAFIIGFAGGLDFAGAETHTEKHGCECVEQAPCKQVWVKEG